MFSILIPSLNNLEYLRLCIHSIRKNSKYKHEIIIHVSEDKDNTTGYLNNENIKYTQTRYNAGICEGVNKASTLSTSDYILYAHDDFYFCPGWDTAILKEVNNLKHNLFYFSGIMIEKETVKGAFGTDLTNFNEKKLLNENKNLIFDDFQGSTWAPHLIHKSIWNKVGGFSEEYFPGTGSDPDLNKKLWDLGVRVFKGIGSSKVYHFGSIVTRKYNKDKYNVTESGNKGAKIFLLKWGITIKFFRKFYLKSDTKYIDTLKVPKRSAGFIYNLFKCKIFYIYIKYIYRFKK